MSYTAVSMNKPITIWWQSITMNTKKFSETIMTHDFSPLVPVVVIHSLRGSCANWRHTPNLQSGAVQQTQDEDHTNHEQSIRVPFGSSLGKDQEPLTITMIGARDNHLPPLNDSRCTKPSRWRQLPRVASETRSEIQSPSASRCNHSSNALGFTSNFTKMIN
jgi:hypothetical protein